MLFSKKRLSSRNSVESLRTYGGFPWQPRSDFYYVAVNAAAIILASLIASLAAGPVGLCMYLYGAALMAANAASHLRATRQAKRYCPGSITGGLLLIPLLMISVWYFPRSGKLDWPWTILSAGAGAAVGWLLFGVDLRRRVRGWNLA